MKSFKTPAIVLKRMDLGEADRLLTLFTYERGKVRAINRGARKPLSKLAGHLEPFSLVQCQLQEGKSFYTITSAETDTAFIGIRNELGKTGQAYYLLEMVDALTADEQSQPALFELLADTLGLLEEGMAPDLLAGAFRLKLLVELGYRPELHSCIHCHEPLQPEGNAFSSRMGGILGPECHRQDDIASAIDPLTIKAMRLLADRSIGIVAKLQAEKKLTQQLEHVTESYLHFQTGRPMRSADFVRDVSQVDKQAKNW